MPPGVPGLVQFMMEKLGLQEGEDDEALTYLLVECSLVTVTGVALTLGGIYGAWKLWSYVRHGCATPDPMARAFDLFSRARAGDTGVPMAGVRGQSGRIPSFYRRIRDSAPRWPRFMFYQHSEDDNSTSVGSDEDFFDVESGENQAGPPLESFMPGPPAPPQPGSSWRDPVVPAAPEVPLLIRREVSPPPPRSTGEGGIVIPAAPEVPLILQRDEGCASRVSPPPPPARSARVELVDQEGAVSDRASLSLAEQIRDPLTRMKLRSSTRDLKD